MLPDRAATREDRVAVGLNLMSDPLEPVRSADNLPPFRPVQGDVVRVHARTIGEEDVETEDVIPGLAILHAAITGGVVPNHASDPAQVLASWVGSESHPALRQVRVQLHEEDAWLDADATALRIELEDPMKSSRGQDHPRTNRGAGDRRPRC